MLHTRIIIITINTTEINYREKIIRDSKSLDGIFFVSNDAMKDFIEIFGEYPNMRVITML